MGNSGTKKYQKVQEYLYFVLYVSKFVFTCQIQLQKQNTSQTLSRVLIMCKKQQLPYNSELFGIESDSYCLLSTRSNIFCQQGFREIQCILNITKRKDCNISGTLGIFKILLMYKFHLCLFQYNIESQETETNQKEENYLKLGPK